MKKQDTANVQLCLFSDSDFETKVTHTDSVDKVMTVEKVVTEKVENFENLFMRLAKSNFRSSFHLKPKDCEYIDEKGMETIRQHAVDFVSKRLAPAVIPNDGRQTPMRGHPVFVAQHATGCCCRGCFYKWHHIPQGRALSAAEQAYAVEVLMAWITREYNRRR